MTNWYKNTIGFIRNWWRQRRRYNNFTGVAFLEPHVDPAEELHRRKLVIIGSRGNPKWLRFACPCRCGEIIALNLMQSFTPRWRVEIHPNKTVSVVPSVDVVSCQSHFWIRENRIHWV